jgi:arylsulfatase A-like enzyme
LDVADSLWCRAMSASILSKRWPWLIAGSVFLAVLVFSVFFEVRVGDADPRPLGTAEDIEALSQRDDVNVLFILIDTLRADRLGSYGYDRDTSPALDVLADRGVRFANTLSQSSWTKCSMASLWTGFYPVRTGVTRFDHKTPAEAIMPAEILRDAGFRTTALFRNGWVSGYFGFDQGFEVYDRPASRRPPPSVRLENPTVKAGGSDLDATSSAKEFLRIHGKERWFLYMHLMDIHEYLYSEDTALFGSDYTDVYDNSIRWTDEALGAFFSYLASEGYLENTLVVIASDHGEAFGERGFEGHARQVYKESTHVPLIFGFPFRLEGGAVVDVQTRNIDIWPTVLDLLGLPAIEGADGRSLVPQILASVRGEEQPELDAPAFAFLDQNWGNRNEDEEPTVAVAQGDYRYVMRPTRKYAPGGQLQLFHLSNDEAELDDLLLSEPEVAENLRALAESFVEDSPPAPWGVETPTLEMNEIQLNQLRALGYALP